MNHHTAMSMAMALRAESKCVSLQVAAMIMRDSRIISTGVNGTPAGYINCCDIHDERGPDHTSWSEVHEIHAEMNAILFAAKHGVSVEGATMYVTTEPCHQCLKNTAAAGINRVIFNRHYYREDEKLKDRKYKFAKDIGLSLIYIEDIL